MKYIMKCIFTLLLVTLVGVAQAAELNGARRSQFSNGEQCGVISLIQDQESEKFHSLNKQSIAVFTFFPSELSPIAGVITLQTQPKTSHISLKIIGWQVGKGWNVPNADVTGDVCLDDYRDDLAAGFENCFGEIKDGDYVHVKTTKRGRLLEINKVEEGAAVCPEPFRDEEGVEEIKLVADLSFTGLPDHSELTWKDHDKVGSKAANYAQLMNLMNEATGTEVVRPGFAIPFYYYNEFIKENENLKNAIEAVLTDEKLNTDSEALYRTHKLEALQDLIMSDAVRVNYDLLEAVFQKTNKYRDLEGKSRRMKFRSSTNSEDLPNFSGAGLYTSQSYKPLKKGRERKKRKKLKKIEYAIKIVWASIWNKRAYDERALYNINHREVYAGIQVNLSFPNELASGVVVSTDPDSRSDNESVFIEAQRGDEYSVENPEEGVLGEQLLVSPLEQGNLEVVRIRYSTVAEDGLTILPTESGVPVLTDADAKKIYELATLAEESFKDLLGEEDKEFALDIEFKVTNDLHGKRTVYFKQARPYLIHD